MSPFTYLSPKTEKRVSPIQGRGLFAAGRIEKGEVVAVKGGYVYDLSKHQEIEKAFGSVDIQISADLFIGPLRQEEVESNMMHLNHSCEPNVGVQGQIVFVGLRIIQPGEELAFDYAMTDDEDYEMACRCGKPACRKRITGRDWQRPELQKKYDGFFSSYLQSLILA